MNTETKHTPGPWHINPVGGLQIMSPCCPDDDESDSVLATAVLDPHALPAGCGRANARLIASAPELLAALSAIVNHGHGEDPLSGRKVIAARAAIAKATL